MWVKKQQLEPDMKQLAGSKLGEEYNMAVYCHPAYLTSMQSVCVCVLVAQSCRNAGLDESQAGIKIAGTNINNLTYAEDTSLMTK